MKLSFHLRGEVPQHTLMFGFVLLERQSHTFFLVISTAVGCSFVNVVVPFGVDNSRLSLNKFFQVELVVVLTFVCRMQFDCFG